MNTLDTAKDGIETAILLALHFSERTRPSIAVEKRKNSAGWSREKTGMEIFCPKKPEFPRHMLTLDVSDDRLFSTSMDDIVVSPEIAIGSGLEVAMLCEDGTMKWTLIKPMPAPRGLAAMSNCPVSWFALHYREIREGQPETYVRRPFPLAKGRVALMNPMGWRGYDPRRASEEIEAQLALALSVFEDANRSGAILATVEDHTKLTFPVDGDAYKAFFAMRDGLRETPTGRRNPILHWCRQHIRRTPGKDAMVAGHERGTLEVIHGPMRLTLHLAKGYGQYLEQNGTGT